MTVRRLADGSWESIATREATEDMNLPKMLHQRVASHPGQVASRAPLQRRRVAPRHDGDLPRRSDSIARGLIGDRARAGDHLAILAPTSYEWALIDVAALSCGAITVPIYETDSASQIAHILADANVRHRHHGHHAARPSWSNPCAPTACAISSPWTAGPSAS